MRGFSTHMHPLTAPEANGQLQTASMRPWRKGSRMYMYKRRILEVEHDSFTLLILSTTGGWGPSAQVTFKRLASLISGKYKKSYSTVKQWTYDQIQDGLLSHWLCSDVPKGSQILMSAHAACRLGRLDYWTWLTLQLTSYALYINHDQGQI